MEDTDMEALARHDLNTEAVSLAREFNLDIEVLRKAEDKGELRVLVQDILEEREQNAEPATDETVLERFERREFKDDYHHFDSGITGGGGSSDLPEHPTSEQLENATYEQHEKWAAQRYQ